MKKKLLFIIVILTIILPLSAKNWISLNKSSKTSLEIVSHNNNATEIHASISGFFIDKGVNNYQILEFENGQIYRDEIGHPAIPYYRRMIAIPDIGEPIITVKNIKSVKLSETYFIQPAQEALFEVKNFKPTWKKDEIFYQTNTMFPNKIAEIKEIGTLRSFRTATIYIYPLQYNPKTGEIEIIYDFDIEITYEGKGENEINYNIPISDRWEPIYKLMLWNYDWVKDSKPKNDSKFNNSKDWNENTWFNEGDYLIIVVSDEMTEKIKKLAAWKTKLGYRPVIKQMPNTITPTALRDSIYSYYSTWTIPPEFVLIVGEGEENEVVNHIEAHAFDASALYSYGVESGIVRNDHYYSLMPNETDYHSDLFVSRIPARDSIELDLWINKIIEYERNPPTSTDWFVSYFCVGDTEDTRIFNVTAKQFALNLVNDGNFTDLDTLLENNYADGVMGAHVLDSIDDGHNIFVFRGHGDEGSGFGWYGGANYGYDDMFLNSDVSAMSTTSMGMGFVFAPTCLAANFTYPNYESMGELMVDMSGKGVTGYFGATNVSLSFYNDSMALGISHALTGASTTREFQVVSVYGKNYMETYAGSATYFELEMYLMNEVGDPACKIWTDIPDTLFVQHDAGYPLGVNSITLYAYDQNSNPVSNATITIWDTTGTDSTFAVGTTDATGYVTLINVEFLDSDGSNEIMITGSKENYIPYEGQAAVLADCPDKPTIINLFNFARIYTTTPSLSFYSTDPDGDNIEYMLYYDTLYDFSTTDSTLTSLYSSGATATYTFPAPLNDNTTYYWKVKGRDPSGSNLYGPFSNIYSFSISTIDVQSNTVSWYQNKLNQFSSCNLYNTTIEKDSIILNSSGGFSEDTIYSENFESGSLPAGWQIVDGDGDAYTWYIATSGQGDMGGYDPPTPGSYYLYYSDDDAGSGNSTAEEYAYAPPVFVDNPDSLKCYYGFGYNDYGTEQLAIDIRSFSGGTWSTWVNYNTYTGSDQNGNALLNLTSLLPCDSVQIRFVYDDNGSWGWAAAIDNIYFISRTEILVPNGTLTSPAITYSDISSIGTRTDWGFAKWFKSSSSDSISIQIEYCNNNIWALIPDGDLSGNSTGFFTAESTGTLDLATLNTSTYDSLRIIANFYRTTTKASLNPVLRSWEVGNTSAVTAIHNSSLGAILTSNGVELQWQPDMNYNTLNYRIFRQKENENYELIAKLPAQNTSYIDNTFEYNHWYSYKIEQVASEKTISIKPIRIYTKDNMFYNISVSENIANNSMIIKYSIPQNTRINISIFDISGRNVKTIKNETVKRGMYQYTLNINDFTSGLYFIRFSYNNKSISKNILLLK